MSYTYKIQKENKFKKIPNPQFRGTSYNLQGQEAMTPQKRAQKFTYHFEVKNYHGSQTHQVKRLSVKNPQDYSVALYPQNY